VVNPELDELVFAPLPVVAVVFEVLPFDCEPELFIAWTACHQFDVEDVVLPEPWDVDRVPAGVSELGFVFADVFDALCVLAVPPLTLGWTLIEGWMVIVG
jgi:hypothetical protein